MARHQFGVKDVVGEVKEGGGGGNTPPPPAGAYKGVLTQMKLQNNKNNDPMLLCVIQLEIKDKHLKKHDGYWVWHRMNLTDQGAPYVNGFLNALAGGEKEGLALQKELWDKGTLTTKSDTLPSDVTKIGNFTIGSPEGKKKIGLVLVERSYTNSSGVEVESVDATRFMPIAGGTAADPDADDGLDDDLTDDSLDEGDDLDSSPGEGGDDLEDDLEEAAPEGDPEADAFSAKLDEVPDLKALRVMARDDYSISAADTKGKTEDEVKDMIFDAWDAARAGAGDPDSDDLDDDLEEKPKATRRAAKSDDGDGEPPF